MVERSKADEINLSLTKSKICYNNNGNNEDDDSNITNHYHMPSCSQHQYHHHLHRHRSHHHLSHRRYHQQKDTEDEDDNNNNDNEDNDERGNNDNDNKDTTNNKNNENDHDDDETYLDAHLHPRLPRLYDRRFCRMNNDDVVNVPVDVDRVRVHRTETTTVHPLVRISSATTATTTANATAVVTATTITNSSVVAAVTKRCKIPPYLAILLLSYTLFGITDACSSRSTPKPRPPTPTDRPNITFHMYTCPPDYAEWYCLNGATCFTVKIVDSLLYNCLCANGYIGQRCEFKDLDGSYLPSRQRVMLETASIAGGATIAVFLVVIICIVTYIHCKRKQKELRSSNTCVDTIDGPGRDPELRPFSSRSRSLMIFTAKNANTPTIEQTRMPNWNCPETESMKMASISESKRLGQ